ncbi:hypothetical protein BV25DRAFT_1883873 [Artomyces pyxidatus]|uniref:Uncharacterized protein n=1 Tax=Artomyces pyxidatus TaxID=48021 RepID=A0ACB8T4S7_9AGAM|nr:hypothetical protein BV25DRAFT_1883873 [Artomyces pyxidatus]
MTVTRGWSAEADKLLDYLEHGIFDALEKQYLRSFIFAIYLDNQDPNNIVEAYTFNFKYYRIRGSDTVVPIMTLGEDLMKMTLGDGRKVNDPVAQATTEGRPPTLRDVKKSLKTLIKVLIHATTQMDSLPKRRFATFKTFYYPHTPASYEPPHFKAGDSERDRWFFTTHKKDEVPEKCSIGKLETGWHGVNVHIASVSAFIPSSTDDNDAPFSGTTNGPIQGPFAMGTAARQAQIEAQERDAHERKIVWDAEKIGRLDSKDVDAEGEDDPEFPIDAVNDSGVGLDAWLPLGVRTNDGDIVPLSREELESEKVPVDGLKGGEPMEVDESAVTQELFFGGLPESIPDCIEKLVSPLPPSDIPTNGCSLASFTSRGIDTQMMIDAIESGLAATKENDLETQVPPSGFDEDPIESFPNDSTHAASPPAPACKYNSKSGDVLDCDCGVMIDEECVLCEGGCGKWYHTWCMGYHSTQDKRLPNEFSCFHCRLRSDENWEMIVVQTWYQDLLSNFGRLALFRRAIKVAEKDEPESSKVFAKLIGCEALVAGQLFKRLEAEGFIAPQANMETGIEDTRAKGRGKTGKGRAKQRKNIQKTKYHFVKSARRSQQYLDYFNPEQATEMRMMGMDKLVRLRRENSTSRAIETQTQEDSQAALNAAGADLKRKKNLPSTSGDDLGTRKKIKISVVSAVDLYD